MRNEEEAMMPTWGGRDASAAGGSLPRHRHPSHNGSSSSSPSRQQHQHQHRSLDSSSSVGGPLHVENGGPASSSADDGGNDDGSPSKLPRPSPSSPRRSTAGAFGALSRRSFAPLFFVPIGVGISLRLLRRLECHTAQWRGLVVPEVPPLIQVRQPWEPWAPARRSSRPLEYGKSPRAVSISPSRNPSNSIGAASVLDDDLVAPARPPSRTIEGYPPSAYDPLSPDWIGGHKIRRPDDKDEDGVALRDAAPHVEVDENGDTTCVPMKQWQTTQYPTCNVVHELDYLAGNKIYKRLKKWVGKKNFYKNNFKTGFGKTGGFGGEAIRLFNRGGVRDVWKVVLGAEDGAVTVLKTLRLNKGFDGRFLEHHRLDAMVMERLTSSDHVFNIYAYCAQSSINEFATDGEVTHLHEYSVVSIDDKLRMSRQTAQSIADLHGIDFPDGTNATLVHRDVGPANYMLSGGKLKLNDFNGCRMMKWDVREDKHCGFRNGFVCGAAGGSGRRVDARSPEECADEAMTEKIDVYGVGVMIFYFLTLERPYAFDTIDGRPLTPDETRYRITSGIGPKIPDELANSDDPKVHAMLNIMSMAFRKDPNERPTAKELVDEFMNPANYVMPKREGRSKAEGEGKTDKAKGKTDKAKGGGKTKRPGDGDDGGDDTVGSDDDELVPLGRKKAKMKGDAALETDVLLVETEEEESDGDDDTVGSDEEENMDAFDETVTHDWESPQDT